MSPSTAAQRAYIQALGYEMRIPAQDYGSVTSFAEASAAIEYLLNERRRVWAERTMSPDMRKAVFAALRHSGRSKEDMYAAMGIESLSEATGGSVIRGRRCLQWIAGEPLEPDHVAPRVSLDNALANMTRPEPPRPPRPEGYVPLDPMLPDPVFHAEPEAAMPDAVPPSVVQVTAPVRRMGRPGLVHPSQMPPRAVAPPVVTTATATAPAPAPVQLQAALLPPVRRPMGRPGVTRPVPVARPVQAAPAVEQPVSVIEDKSVVSQPEQPLVYAPPVFVPRAMPLVDKRGLSAVEVMTRQRLQLLNDLLTTTEGIDYLRRLAESGAPAWQTLADDWSRDIPF